MWSTPSRAASLCATIHAMDTDYAKLKIGDRVRYTNKNAGRSGWPVFDALGTIVEDSRVTADKPLWGVKWDAKVDGRDPWRTYHIVLSGESPINMAALEYCRQELGRV